MEFDIRDKSTYSITTMRIMKGIAASSGIVIGKVFLYATQSLKAPRYIISDGDITQESIRFKDALSRAKEDLLH